MCETPHAFISYRFFMNVWWIFKSRFFLFWVSALWLCFLNVQMMLTFKAIKFLESHFSMLNIARCQKGYNTLSYYLYADIYYISWGIKHIINSVFSKVNCHAGCQTKWEAPQIIQYHLVEVKYVYFKRSLQLFLLKLFKYPL